MRKKIKNREVINIKKISAFIIFLLLSIIFSSISANSLSVEPMEISINMNDSFIQGNTTKKITVINSYDYEYNVTWYVENPNPSSEMRQNKTFMPNLSWIDVEPKWQILPAKTKGNFYIILNIPENETNIAKNWEAWITFKGGEQTHFGGIFNYEYAIRVYINTPTVLVIDDLDPVDSSNEKEKITNVSFSVIIISFLIGLMIVLFITIKIKKS